MIQDQRGLAGKRILVTREQKQAEVFSDKIKKVSGIPVVIPLLTFQFPADPKPLHNAIKNIESYDWIVLTSRNGVEFFFEALKAQHMTPSQLAKHRFAVVGRKTEEALREYGLEADVVPDQFVAESLAEAFQQVLTRGERILFPKGNLARSVLKDTLQPLGMIVDDVVCYETVRHDAVAEQIIDVVQNQTVDLVTFTSPSTVEAFFSFLDDKLRQVAISSFQFACIGPITKVRLREYGVMNPIMPTEYSVEGLLQAIIEDDE